MKGEASLKALLTIPEVSFRLGLSRSTTYRLIMEGQIASITVGRSRRVPAAAVDDFIAKQLRDQAVERWADELRLGDGGGWDE